MADSEPPESGQMVVAASPEPLPLGWTEKVASKDGEEVKFYYNVITGQKFYSKADLLRYVELGSPSQGTRRRTRAQNEGNPESRLELMPAVMNNTPEWLPQGWIMELNATSNGSKYKRYIDPLTGRKFYSKPEILKYLNSDECNDPISKQAAMSIVSASNLLPAATDDAPEWLPQGWIMELKTRSNGRNLKRYIDPLTGQKFYSKPQIDRYLNSDKSKDPTSEHTAMSIPQKPEGSQSLKGTSSASNRKQMRSSNSQKKNVEVLRYEEERLPPGWIKEIKIDRTGNKIRRDPFYTDPDSKYVFRSVPDAFRYLETKDIMACVMRPKKREELWFLTDDPPLHILEEKQLLLLDNTTEICTEKEENQDPTSGQLPSAPASKRKRGRPVAAPSPNNIKQHEKQAEVIIDSTKSEGEKVPSSLCRSSTQIVGSEPNSVQVIAGEAATTDDNVRTEVKGEEKNLGPQPIERLGRDPCLAFAFKTLRGDIPVEANNLAAQGYNHHQRASVNVGLPSFSDYARRQM